MSFTQSQRNCPFKPVFHSEGEYQFDPGRSLKNDKIAWNAAIQQATPLKRIRATKKDYHSDEIWRANNTTLRKEQAIREMQVDVTVQD